MSLESLDQALLEAKWGDAEADAVEVIARVLELPQAAVERVLYAAGSLKKDDRFTQLREFMFDGVALSEDLRTAIQVAVGQGMRRAAVRYVIQNGGTVMVKMGAFSRLGARVCDGCPLSMRCALDNISTVQRCMKSGPPAQYQEPTDKVPGRLLHWGRGSGAPATPLRLYGNKVVVVCDQPRGEWTVALEDLDL